MTTQITGLCDFLAAVGHSGTIARMECEKAALQSIDRYLQEPDANGVTGLKTQHIRIGEQIFNVPELGLAPPEHLDLKSLEICFETVVDMTSPQVGMDADTVISPTRGNPKISIGLSKGLLENGTEINVKAVYELQEATETAQQIRDKINKTLAMEA